MIGHIAESVRPDCYALSWSYGEICCHCGCCSDDPVKRAKARLEYHMEELKRCKEFDHWFDDPEIRAVQERNLAEDIKHHTKKVWEYRAEVERLEGNT